MHPLVARSGDEALALHRERGAEFALVLLDLNMPGLPGEAVYRALRRASPALPILVSSGQPKAEAVARIRNGEPFEFLQKPYGADVLRQRVRALLEQRAA
jgi:DNA-binding response OmpR family regulator